MPQLGMIVLMNHGTEAVVVLADLPHGGVPVDPCDDGKGDDSPIDLCDDGNRICVDLRCDGGCNNWSPCGFLVAALVPELLALRCGVPVDPHSDHRI